MAEKKKELPFNPHKYQPAPARNNYVDGTGVLANRLSHVISFRNIRNDRDVLFKAFITDYNESFTPNFTPNEVFGRTDPIYQYKNTSRNISLSFKIPASTESEAYENIGRVQGLLQMTYPSYKSVNSALTLSEAPLVRLKVMNILRSQASLGEPTSQGTSKPDSKYFTEYVSTAESDKGQLGIITNIVVNSMLNSTDGVFHKLTTIPQDEDTGAAAVTRTEPNTVLPKLIEIAVNFSPIHEQTLGYENETAKGSFSLFPYGIRLSNEGAKPNLPSSVSEEVKNERSEEEARQRAASAQQEEDKAKAEYERLLSEVGETSETARAKFAAERAERASDDADAAYKAAQAEASKTSNEYLETS